MTYNETFFATDLERNKRKLNNLILLQTNIYNLLGEFLFDAKDHEQKRHFYCFLNLLGKIRISLEAINTQLLALYSDYRFKLATNLLYRSVVDDIIMINYLHYFIDNFDDEQTSLGNELQILHKEYIQSAIEGLTAENEYNLIEYTGKNIKGKDERDAINALKSDSNLIDKNGNWKLNSVLRDTTRQEIKDKLPPVPKKENAKKFISESERINFLKTCGFKGHYELKFLFKYYSQFHHYTPNGIAMVSADIDYELNTYHHCINQLITLINVTFPLINYSKKNETLNMFTNITELYKSIYTKE